MSGKAVLSLLLGMGFGCCLGYTVLYPGLTILHFDSALSGFLRVFFYVLMAISVAGLLATDIPMVSTVVALHFVSKSGLLRLLIGDLDKESEESEESEDDESEEDGGVEGGVLARLPTWEWVHGEEAEPCILCHREGMADELWLALPCSHFLHAAPCASSWLHAHNTCPLCHTIVALPVPLLP